MHRVLQYLNDGQTFVEVPVPLVRHGHLLIRTAASVISPGTERMLLDFGNAGVIEKARQQPDRLRMALDKIRTDGLVPHHRRGPGEAGAADSSGLRILRARA